MADFSTPSRLGQANTAGATDDLFLEMFSGEVMLTYKRATVAKQRHLTKPAKGKAVTFSEIGDASATTHTPGVEIDPGAIAHGERTIAVEDLVIAPVFVADWDEVVNHFEVRSRYAEKLGQALGNRVDRDVFRNALKAARETAANPALTGAAKNGYQVSAGATVTSNPDVLIAAALEAAQALDEKEVVDNNNRTMFVRPAEFWLLLSTGNIVIDRDYGGEGSVARGMISRVGNLEIVKSNNLRVLAGVDETMAPVDTNTPAAYIDNWTNTVAVVTTPEAVGTGEWMKVNTQREYSVRHQGWLLVSRLIKGNGVLRPECAVEIQNV